jgi:hypothetical protein
MSLHIEAVNITEYGGHTTAVRYTNVLKQGAQEAGNRIPSEAASYPKRTEKINYTAARI